MSRLWCALAGDADLFDAAWPLLARAIKDAPRAEVWTECAVGRAQLWLTFKGDAISAAMVTQSGNNGTLHIWGCAGKRCNWRDLLEQLVAAATGHFERLTIDGRAGWLRVVSGFARRDDGLLERALR